MQHDARQDAPRLGPQPTGGEEVFVPPVGADPAVSYKVFVHAEVLHLDGVGFGQIDVVLLGARIVGGNGMHGIAGFVESVEYLIAHLEGFPRDAGSDAGQYVKRFCAIVFVHAPQGAQHEEVDGAPPARVDGGYDPMDVVV